MVFEVEYERTLRNWWLQVASLNPQHIELVSVLESSVNRSLGFEVSCVGLAPLHASVTMIDSYSHSNAMFCKLCRPNECILKELTSIM